GEFDRLLLESNGFQAVTSTGGAKTFRQDWADQLESVADVYICFDNDEAGRSGALRVGRMILHAKIVTLPEEVGDGGDVPDFIVQYIQLRPSGSNLVGLCPFHEDHIPSFTVYPAAGTFHCYGCGKHGDVITFVREMEHLNFGQTLDALDRFTSQRES